MVAGADIEAAGSHSSARLARMGAMESLKRRLIALLRVSSFPLTGETAAPGRGMRRLGTAPDRRPSRCGPSPRSTCRWVLDHEVDVSDAPWPPARFQAGKR